MKILALSQYYLPGSGGGTIRALANIVERFASKHAFWIVTTDRDVAASAPYPGVTTGQWTKVGAARVYYDEQRRLTRRVLERLTREVAPDLIHPVSLFSPLTVRALLSRRTGRLPVPMMIAPHGEFSPGALAQKTTKKTAFLTMARATGLFRELSWQATSEHEAAEIRRALGDRTIVRLAPVLRPAIAQIEIAPPLPKLPGVLRLLYLSRVTPKKNLHYLIERLGQVRGSVELDVIGPADDVAYLSRCRSAAANLPPNIEVRFLPEVRHDDVAAAYAARHVLVLPTLGENFGFVILEALAAGRPVIVSDRTPWRNLEQAGAGWDLDLGQPGNWIAALQRCVDLPGDQYTALCARAARHARATIDDDAIDAAFEAALTASSSIAAEKRTV